MKTSSPFSSVERCGVMRVRVVSLIFRHCIPHKTLDPPPFSAPLLPPMNPEDSIFSTIFEKTTSVLKTTSLSFMCNFTDPPPGNGPVEGSTRSGRPSGKAPRPGKRPLPRPVVARRGTQNTLQTCVVIIDVTLFFSSTCFVGDLQPPRAALLPPRGGSPPPANDAGRPYRAPPRFA